MRFFRSDLKKRRRKNPTEKEMRLADPGSTKTPFCPTNGLSRFPERATISPSAFLGGLKSQIIYPRNTLFIRCVFSC